MLDLGNADCSDYQIIIYILFVIVNVDKYWAFIKERRWKRFFVLPFFFIYLNVFLTE